MLSTWLSQSVRRKRPRRVEPRGGRRAGAPGEVTRVRVDDVLATPRHLAQRQPPSPFAQLTACRADDTAAASSGSALARDAFAHAFERLEPMLHLLGSAASASGFVASSVSRRASSSRFSCGRFLLGAGLERAMERLERVFGPPEDEARGQSRQTRALAAQRENVLIAVPPWPWSRRALVGTALATTSARDRTCPF